MCYKALSQNEMSKPLKKKWDLRLASTSWLFPNNLSVCLPAPMATVFRPEELQSHVKSLKLCKHVDMESPQCPLCKDSFENVS